MPLSNIILPGNQTSTSVYIKSFIRKNQTTAYRTPNVYALLYPCGAVVDAPSRGAPSTAAAPAPRALAPRALALGRRRRRLLLQLRPRREYLPLVGGARGRRKIMSVCKFTDVHTFILEKPQRQIGRERTQRASSLC